MSEWTSGAVAEEAEEAEAADGKAERGARFASLFPFLLSLALLPPRRRRRRRSLSFRFCIARPASLPLGQVFSAPFHSIVL